MRFGCDSASSRTGGVSQAAPGDALRALCERALDIRPASRETLDCDLLDPARDFVGTGAIRVEAKFEEPGAVPAQETITGYKFARQSAEFQAQSLSLEEKRTEEWWKELVQPSTVLAGEAEVKEADLTDPRGVVTECSGKAGFEAPVDTDRGAAATKWGQIARAKSWDEVRAPLAVYRFSGVQLDEDPRRTGEYRAPEA